MKTDEIKTIGVAGSGTMGRGIAICAAGNYKTILYDINDEVIAKSKVSVEKQLAKSLEKKKLTEEKHKEITANIKYTSEFNDFKDCDLVIEAALEDMDLKKDIFSGLDTLCRPDAILATNTSSLSVTTISTFVKQNPSRVAGMHFFNPANIMKLVEIIRGSFTSEETINTLTEISKILGKTPVTAKDTPAFIVNRVARPFYGEALKILSDGTSDAASVDKILKTCGGFAMGSFELMDLIGIDVNFSVTKSVYEAFFNDPKYRPSFIQKKMVDANLLGRKTGEGFYKYGKENK